MKMMHIKTLASAAAIAWAAAAGMGSAQAAPIITAVNADLSASPYSFSFMGGSFTFSGDGGFPNYLSVSTTGSAAVRTVFGNPSTDFVDRGTVVYDQNTLGGFGSFAMPAAISPSNGFNFLGLRVTSGSQNYYGFAYSTNSVLNSFGFETMPETGITATTESGTAAVPEPTSWALMLVGFGATGVALRSRRKRALQLG